MFQKSCFSMYENMHESINVWMHQWINECMHVWWWSWSWSWSWWWWWWWWWWCLCLESFVRAFCKVAAGPGRLSHSMRDCHDIRGVSKLGADKKFWKVWNFDNSSAFEPDGSKAYLISPGVASPSLPPKRRGFMQQAAQLPFWWWIPV